MSVSPRSPRVTAAAVPVLVGLLGGDRSAPGPALGILLALVAVVLVSAEGGLAQLRAARPASLTAPLLAGAAFGSSSCCSTAPSDDSGLTPLVAARLASVALVVRRSPCSAATAAGGPDGPAAGRSFRASAT